MIPPGETREFTFLAGSPGTYYYWGATEAATLLGQRRGVDTQLTGAFVVDRVARARARTASCLSATGPITFRSGNPDEPSDS